MDGWTKRVAVAVVGLVIVVVAVRIVRGPEVDQLVTYDGLILGGAEVEAGVVVAGDASRESHGVRLVRLHPTSGRVEAERVLPDVVGLPDVGGFGPAALLRIRGRPLPHVPTVDDLYPGRAGSPDDQWLLVIDGSDLTPVRQIRLPDVGPLVYEPLTVLEGRVWFHGSAGPSGALTRRGTLDLATGRLTTEEVVLAPGPPGIRNVQRTADSVVVVRWNQFGILDRETGASRSWHTFPEPMPPLPTGFVFHEGSFWMSGSGSDDWDLMYLYDPETGRMTDPRPAGELPVWTFDDGDERWELYEPDGERQAVPYAEPEPDSMWRRVDIDTGALLGEYELGRWRVRFTTARHAWLVRLDEGGTVTLGRVEL